MKTLRNIATTIGLAAVISSAALSAETNRSTANIPFDFQIGRATLPAGPYAVTLASDTKVLTFRNLADGKTIALLTHAYKSGTQEQPKLTFRHEGDRYTMESVWFAGVDGGYAPLKGKRDRAEGERGMVATVRLLQK